MPDPDRTDALRLPAATKRLVALGDPHGDLVGLDLVFAQEQRPDTAFVSVGDNIGYADGVVSSFLCKLLIDRGVPSVCGNHEAWSEDGKVFLGVPGHPRDLTPEARAWIEDLPYRIRIRADAAPNVVIHIVHTLPDWAYVKTDSVERMLDVEAEAHVVFSGHTHRPAIYALKAGRRNPKVHRLNPRGKSVVVPYEPNTRYIVDAGSLARPVGPRQGKAYERATYGVFDMEQGSLELHALDKTEQMQAIYERMLSRPAEDPGSPSTT